MDGAIHRAAGPRSWPSAACSAAAPRATRRHTGGGRLPARHVIHTVGPIWGGGKQGEDELLASAHRRSLEVAAELGARSVAFPAISTGIYGFPIERAAPIALNTAEETTERLSGIELVRFVLFSDDDLQVFQQALAAPG